MTAGRKPGALRALDKKEYETLAAFRYALRQFFRFSETAAEEVGLAPQQYQAMLAIKGFPGRDYITVNELARQLLIKHNSAVGLVNRLALQGLARREPSREDARMVLVSLTAPGVRVFEKLAAAHRNELRRIAPQLIQFYDYFSSAPAAAISSGRKRPVRSKA